MSWLREYAPTDLPADELADLITHRGVKVEGILRPWSGLDGVIAVRVLEIRDHPDSDKLCVARIHHGAGESELVVGVRNMVVGDLVPWAPPGSHVPVLDEALGRRTIRGVLSDGMLCSPRELALGQEHTGILVLPAAGWNVGDELKAVLGLDEVLDIEIEPNRPDLASVFGVAREVAAATRVPLGAIDLELDETEEPASGVAPIRIEAPQACSRYVARVLRGVSHGPAPIIARARLAACGMRPIDAVVDATNYVMLELGQPLHGFDLERLAGPAIVVRKAQEGERLLTLDGVERVMTAEDLMIRDAEGPVAIAGVMGGRDAEVTGSTTDVLLESAHFDRAGVLLTARRLDLHSEASYRFERGTDPEIVEQAAQRCAQLISAWTGASVLAGVAQAGTRPPRRWVAMRPARAGALLGYPVPPEDAGEVFDALGLRHRDAGDAIEVEVPGYRADIDGEVDLIEEVVRIQGYARVGSTLPKATHAGGVPATYAWSRRAKDALVRAGLREIRPMPFASAEDLDLFGDTDAVPVANPLRAEEGYLRTRLTPGLLRTLARDQALGSRQVAIFEVGITFRLADPFIEHRKAGFAMSGPAGEGWAATKRVLDVLDAKGVVASLMEELGVSEWSLGDVPAGPFHPGRSAQVLVAGRPAGILGEIHPTVAEALGIDGRVAVGVVGLSGLATASDRGSAFRDLPRFPPLRRDLAFIVADDVAAGLVQAAIEDAAGPLLTGCLLFDVYRGEGIEPGTKSLAFALDLRAPDRTLTDEEAAPVIEAVIDHVRSSFDATLRAG